MARKSSVADRVATPAKPKSKKAADEKAPESMQTPSRSSARQANKRFNAEYGTDVLETPIKDEDVPASPYKANVGAKRASSGSDTPASKRVKIEDPEVSGVSIKQEDNGLPSPDETPSEDESELSVDEDERPVKPSTPKGKKTKTSSKTTGSPADKEAVLQAKKLKSYSQFSKTSPFPDFLHPTADEARLAHRILAGIHGEKTRPEKVVARADRAGCGDSPSVLDALVRTILSQNTSDTNSTRAKLSMDKVYGGSDQWEKIVQGGQAKLQEAIKSGGLSVVKSKVIIGVLEQAKEKYGKYSLDHLFEKTDEEAMTELIGMKGVGPKTASCVLLFCLQRESFAVDTHVYRIAGLLGWRPKNASRDETHAHLEVRIPDEEKYGLHILMVGHGKKCDECKAGGKSVGKCALRRAFRKGKLEGEAGEDVKEDEEDIVKDEGGDPGDVKKELDGLESGQEDYVHGMQSGRKAVKKEKA